MDVGAATGERLVSTQRLLHRRTMEFAADAHDRIRDGRADRIMAAARRRALLRRRAQDCGAAAPHLRVAPVYARRVRQFVEDDGELQLPDRRRADRRRLAADLPGDARYAFSQRGAQAQRLRQSDAVTLFDASGHSRRREGLAADLRALHAGRLRQLGREVFSRLADARRAGDGRVRASGAETGAAGAGRSVGAAAVGRRSIRVMAINRIGKAIITGNAKSLVFQLYIVTATKER